MQPPPLFPAALRVARVLRDAGFTALYAGGCVRDKLLGRPVKDVDIATSARPEEVEALFPGRTVAVGKAFGVILVLEGGHTFDVATFRADGLYLDGRRPDGITFSSPEQDAQRRDLTVNGLFYDPFADTVIDYVDGRADLDRRLIRTIGDPLARFGEDRLRLMRAIRFAAVLDFAIDPATHAAIAALAPRLAEVSAERIGIEFVRTLCESVKPSRALDDLLRTGLLAVFLPELVRLKNCAQPPEFHPEGDVWTHTGLMLDTLPAPRDPILALAVLLHDIGKPPARLVDETGRIRFPNHAPMGARLAADILARLKQPAAVCDAVADIVGRHMHFVEIRNLRPAKLRRLLGRPLLPTELELHHLDCLFSNGDLDSWQFARDELARYQAEPILPEPFIKGRDLLAAGFAPGPALGQKLQELYDAQLEGRFASREEALATLQPAAAKHPVAADAPTHDKALATLGTSVSPHPVAADAFTHPESSP